MAEPIPISPQMALETETPVRMPGDVLQQDYLQPRRLSVSLLARRSGVSTRRIDGILQGTRSITPEVAMRFAVALGTTAFYWLVLQARWSLDLERRL